MCMEEKKTLNSVLIISSLRLPIIGLLTSVNKVIKLRFHLILRDAIQMELGLLTEFYKKPTTVRDAMVNGIRDDAK